MTAERQALRRRRLANPLGEVEAVESIHRAEIAVYRARLGGPLEHDFRDLGRSLLELARELAVLGCILDDRINDHRIEGVALLDGFPVRSRDPFDQGEEARSARLHVRGSLVGFWSERLRARIRPRDPRTLDKSPYGQQILAARDVVPLLDRASDLAARARRVNEAVATRLHTGRKAVPPGRRGGRPADPARAVAVEIVRLLRVEPFGDFPPWTPAELQALFRAAARDYNAPYLQPFADMDPFTFADFLKETQRHSQTQP